MSEIKVSLMHGYKVGDDLLKDAVIRPYTTADLLEAEEESEKLEMIIKPEGGVEHQLVLSPALYGLNIFRRQIVQIGDIGGPFEISQLKSLHRDDYSLLQQKVDALDQASDAKEAAKEIKKKGEG